jgi:hypothetical protein
MVGYTISTVFYFLKNLKKKKKWLCEKVNFVNQSTKKPRN